MFSGFPDLEAPDAKALLHGTAPCAFTVQPAFDGYVFIERNSRRQRTFDQLKARQGHWPSFAPIGYVNSPFTAELKKGLYVYYHCTGAKGPCGNSYIREEISPSCSASL